MSITRFSLAIPTYTWVPGAGPVRVALPIANLPMLATDGFAHGRLWGRFEKVGNLDEIRPSAILVGRAIGDGAHLSQTGGIEDPIGKAAADYSMRFDTITGTGLGVRLFQYATLGIMAGRNAHDTVRLLAAWIEFS